MYFVDGRLLHGTLMTVFIKTFDGKHATLVTTFIGFGVGGILSVI